MSFLQTCDYKHKELTTVTRHRCFILLYITWLTLTLVPAMVAPPERTFDRGQPEMQQAMDNMVSHKPVIQKRVYNFPIENVHDSIQTETDIYGKDTDQVMFHKGRNGSNRAIRIPIIQKRSIISSKENVQDSIPKGTTYSTNDSVQSVVQNGTNISSEGTDQDANSMKKFLEVNNKTSELLTEAEKVLKTLPESKERQWVESFVERMQEIAKMLEVTSERKMAGKDVPMNDAPQQGGFSKRPTQPAISAVPDVNPFQKAMTSKLQMTSPKTSRVLQEDELSDKQAVTRPVVMSLKVEDSESDELVRELESLHEEHKNEVVSKESKAVTEVHTTETPLTTLAPVDNHTASIWQEALKAKAEEQKLINELEDFHRQGGVLPKPIVDILYADSHKTTGSFDNRKINVDEFTEAGMKDRRGIMKVNDINNDDREISMANMRNVSPYVAQQFPYMRVNHTFPSKHPNMIQGIPRYVGPYFQNIPPKFRAASYPGYPHHLNQNFQKMVPYNQGKYHELDMVHPQGANPGMLKQRVPRPQYYYNGRLPPYNYPNYMMRPVYTPYPYMHNLNPHNSSDHMPQMMPSYPNNQPKIDTQLSDEMKRELRDGKIIVLSDSVVRSNFQPDKNEKSDESTTGKPDLLEMDVKNETVTQN